MFDNDIFGRNKKQGIHRNIVNSNLREENNFNTLHKTRDFDNDKYNQGKLWFHNGFALEKADITLRSNMSFIKGYNHAKKLASISRINRDR